MPRTKKSSSALRTISEVAQELELPQHVLRFWETKFSKIRPLKRGGGRRYYRPEDIVLLKAIKTLLHEEGYTIKGVQNLLRKKAGLKSFEGEQNTEAGQDNLTLDKTEILEIKSIIKEFGEIKRILDNPN